MKILDSNLIKKVLGEARQSPRRRAIYCFHNQDDALQRMVNACLSGTYVQPHKHENPDKLEIFNILKGIVAVPLFDDYGHIKEVACLNERGPVKGVEIPPKSWHTVVVLSDEAVLYEIIEGKYDVLTHKDFAPWAPSEGSEDSGKYLKDLIERLPINYQEA